MFIVSTHNQCLSKSKKKLFTPENSSFNAKVGFERVLKHMINRDGYIMYMIFFFTIYMYYTAAMGVHACILET